MLEKEAVWRAGRRKEGGRVDWRVSVGVRTPLSSVRVVQCIVGSGDVDGGDGAFLKT